VGGENLPLDRLWELLAQICGRRPPTAHIPYGLALALGWADDLRCRFFAADASGLAAPLVPLEGVRMARHAMFVDDAKARAELGHEATSVRAALERAVKWYYDHGYAV
jgi:dihydroflavonol-4-reductase